MMGISAKMENGRLFLGGVDLIPELHNLSYVVRHCRAADRLRQGNMSFEDY